jgi:hypothetical protein
VHGLPPLHQPSRRHAHPCRHLLILRSTTPAHPQARGPSSSSGGGAPALLFIKPAALLLLRLLTVLHHLVSRSQATYDSLDPPARTCVSSSPTTTDDGGLTRHSSPAGERLHSAGPTLLHPLQLARSCAGSTCPLPMPAARGCAGGMGGDNGDCARGDWSLICGEKIGARARTGGRKAAGRWIASRNA